MINATELLREDKFSDLWNRYCGFIDLDIDKFMKIQERLLFEQIELFSKSKIGNKLIGKELPHNLKEFKEIVPVTSYNDYVSFLNNKDEESLPSKPLFWAMTTGKPGEYDEKWAPYPYNSVLSNARAFLGALIMSTAINREKINFIGKKQFLYGMAPLPYITGTIPYGLKYEYEFNYIPPVENAEKMSFEQRNFEGFELGFKKGIDYFFGVASVLVKVGESFSNYTSKIKPGLILKQPAKYFLVSKAKIKSMIFRRNILPKDIWNLSGIICGGIDASLYAEKIEYLWGKKPLELYGGTEIGIAAYQAWNRKNMTFIPYTNFYEFIPWKEHEKNRLNPNYKPKTVFLNDVRKGELYELVITSFNGGAFIRYRIGDIIKIMDYYDEESKIMLPQIRFENRTEDIIDIGGFTRLTERTILHALINSKLKFYDWVVRKEINDKLKEVYIHLYIETIGSNLNEHELTNIIHDSIKEIDHDYKDYEHMIGKKPIKVTKLKNGTFSSYKKIKKSSFPDSDNLIVIQHMNISNESIRELLEISEVINN